MKTQPQHAEARFSEFPEACLARGRHVVTRHGYEVAVLVAITEWRRLHAAAMPSLKQLLLKDEARIETLVAPRGEVQSRLKI